MIEGQIKELRLLLGEIADVRATLSLLHWDQQTYMPPKGAPARAEQQATLSGIAHRLFVSPRLGDLLRGLNERRRELSPEDSILVAETLYDYERATKLPEEFVRLLAETESHALHAWEEARKTSDYSLFQPHFSRLVELQKEKAGLLGYEGSPYNALLEDYERGMTVEELKHIFGNLVEHQVKLIDRILGSSVLPDEGWYKRRWDSQAQWDFGMKVLSDIGFDLEAGRQDQSTHPFTTGFDIRDVRLTTRIRENDLFSGLSSTLHEGGHGLYDQGFDERDRRTPLADAPSLGMHESQSRLWENLIGRSLPFWKHYTPVMRTFFPDLAETVGPEDIYRLQNRVRPSLIRVEADECTYNLHVILRFEIEVDLLEGRLDVSEVPGFWNSKIKQYLGLEVPNDNQGCLQDIHWSGDSFGYFPTYALGNLYSAQIFEKLQEEIPDLWNRVEKGEFSDLLAWLRQKIHRYGRRKTAREMIRDITGKEPGSESYIRYLEQKYADLYGL